MRWVLSAHGVGRSGGRTWSAAEAIAGSGCAWPELVSLKQGPTIIISGRLCVEGMAGAFLWMHDDPTQKGSAKSYRRYSIPCAPKD